jgi:hypothetical protein
MTDDARTKEPGGHYAASKIAQADALIRDGKIRRGLNALSNAAYNVRDEGDFEAALARIRELATTAANAEGGRYQSKAQGVLDQADRQARYLLPAQQGNQGSSVDQEGVAQSSSQPPEPELTPWRGDSPGSPRPATVSALPWFYGAADVVARIAIVASVLTVIGGIIVGIELSRYHAIGDLGQIVTRHHAGVIAYWITIGVFTAAVWMALAVGLKLLADVGLSLRAARRQAPEA